MEEIIYTDQLIDKFNKNCRDQYCGIVLSKIIIVYLKDRMLLRNTNILLFRPIYRKAHHKRESFSYNEALTEHTYHDFSEIADFIKVNEVKETTKVLANTSFKEHLLSMPQNQSFYIDVADEPFCKAVFTDNKAYVYEDGSIGREVKILYFYPSDNKSRTKQNHTTKQVK